MSSQYALFCEDNAQRIFLKEIIPIIIKKTAADYSDFPFSSPEFNKLEVRNKTELKKYFINASKIVFRNFSAKLFIVCFDADSSKTDDDLRQKQEWISIVAKENSRNQDKFIFAVTVQAIEHWLCYLKYIKNKSSKLKAGDLERYPQENVKKEIYEKEEYQSISRESIISNLVSNTSAENIDSLRSNSSSFNRFYSDLETFLIKSKQ